MEKLSLIGIANALLLNINAIAQQADPQQKITPVGFLRMLLENNAMTEVANLTAIQNGLDHDIKVRYMQRGTVSEATDTDDCDTPITPVWKETTLTRQFFSKIGIFISDEQMRKFQEEAVQTMAITANGANAGAITTPLMRGLYETIIVHANALVQKMDKNLLTAQKAAFGKNIAYGSADAQTINFDTKAALNDGIIKLMLDAQANEFTSDMLIVGNGIVQAVDMYNRFKSGVDLQGIGALPFRSYYDAQSASIWGANYFGVFEKGQVGLVDFNKNVGSFAGERGDALFFTIPVPYTLADGTLSTLKFDAQLWYEKCPVYSGTTKVADRGWKLVLSKSYGLFNTPTDAYASTDPMYGANGSLQYIGAAASKAADSASLDETEE